MPDAHLKPLEEQDLPMVRAWRNHIGVRRFMYTQHEISAEEHQRWFLSSRDDPQRHHYLFILDGSPQGFINFREMNTAGVADWGFYLAPEAPRGTGSALGRLALDQAFAALGLHKLCGQALGYNERSIRFHRRLGFREEGILRDQHHDGVTYHPIHCFGLLHHEWEAHKGNLDP